MILMIHSMLDQHTDRIRTELHEEVIVRDHIEEVDAEMTRAEIIIGFGKSLKSLTPERLEQFPRLKWIHVDVAGVDMLPFARLQEKEILVTNTRGIQGPQVSEQILGMMIMFARGMHINFKNQALSHWDNNNQLERLYGKTLCIIGTGHLGQELAQRAKAFEMKVIGIRNRAGSLADFDDIYPAEKKHQALEQADYVAALLPLTPKTRHFMGKKEFEVMKSTAVFLNFSRGETVDQVEMTTALKQKKIHGAGLDVFAQEPLPKEDPLWQMPNVIISPHNAGLVHNDHDLRKLNVFMEQYASYKKGEPMSHLIHLKERY